MSSSSWGSGGTVRYLFIDEERSALVGSGGCQGAPDADGMVEIGCAVAPVHRRHGYATQAVRQLVNRASRDPAVLVRNPHREQSRLTSVLAP